MVSSKISITQSRVALLVNYVFNSANETYYRGTRSSFTTCYCLCWVTHSKGDRLSVERKKKYFAAEHLGYCGGTYQALRGGKIDCIYKAVCDQRFFAGYSWYVFSLLKLAMNTARVSLLLRSMMKLRRFYNC